MDREEEVPLISKYDQLARYRNAIESGIGAVIVLSVLAILCLFLRWSYNSMVEAEANRLANEESPLLP